MIGGGVAVSMARRGRIPAVYDIKPDAADNLEGVSKPLSSPADVAKTSDVVMVAVVNAVQAFDVISGPEGQLEGAHSNLIIVLLSTVALPVVYKLAELCTRAKVAFLDCGVTPGNKAAENGMVAIVGGDDDVVERARPVLEDWAKKLCIAGRWELEWPQRLHGTSSLSAVGTPYQKQACWQKQQGLNRKNSLK